MGLSASKHGRWSSAFVAAVVASLVLVAGCAQPSGAGGAETVSGSWSYQGSSDPVRSGFGPGSDSAGPFRSGIAYVSVGVVGRELVKGTMITLTYTDGKVVARAGCNTISGPARITADRLNATGPLAVTAMGCGANQEEWSKQDKQDSWLAQFLAGSPALVAAGDGFSLTSGGVTVTMAPVPPEPAVPLVGTEWTLTTLISGSAASSVEAGTAPYLRIEGDTLTYTDGCNIHEGTVQVEGSTMSISRPGSWTDMGCSQAKQIAAVLSGSVGYRIEGRQLTITAANGDALQFQGNPAPADAGSGVPTSTTGPTASTGSETTTGPETSEPGKAGAGPAVSPGSATITLATPPSVRGMDRSIPESPEAGTK